MSSYTINGVTHQGFRRSTVRPQPTVGEIVVVVWFEGEPELYIADNLEAVETIKGIWRKDWPQHDMEITVCHVTGTDLLVGEARV